MELRDYQVGLIEQLREGYKAGHMRQLAVSPTGSGKTVLFSFICRSSVQRGQRAIVLAHRAEILTQIEATLDKVGVRHGAIQAGKPMTSAPVLVASVQTLARRLDKVTAPDLIIVDEAHHGVAGQYVDIMAAYSKSRVLGVTATPERLDGRGLGSMFSRMVMGPSVATLIERGFLARPEYYAPTTVDMAGVKKVAGEFSRSESEAKVDKPQITGDVIRHYRKHLHDKRAVAFCVSVAHAKHVAETFRANGIPAAEIEGSMGAEDRRKLVDDLGSGALKVLTSCELISEGFDIPAIDGAILLRPTASLAMHLQQIGRALRSCPGKTRAVILDHVGNTMRHGFAETAREWSLDGRPARKKAEGERPPPKTCAQCFAVFDGPRCPQCGEVPQREREIEQVDGELSKVSKEEIEARFMRRREEAQCKSLGDWIKLAKARGYAPGWAFHRHRARGGK